MRKARSSRACIVPNSQEDRPPGGVIRQSKEDRDADNGR